MSNVYVEYTGPGYVQGVPARDLTREDWDALTDEQKKAAVNSSGVYKFIKAVKPKETDEK